MSNQTELERVKAARDAALKAAQVAWAASATGDDVAAEAAWEAHAVWEAAEAAWLAAAATEVEK